MTTQLSVELGETMIDTATRSWDSDVDSYIGNFLSNWNNVRKVIGLDVERIIDEGSEETEDYRKGSNWSERKNNERKVTDEDPKRTVNEDSAMKSRVAISQLCDGDTCLIIQLPFLDSVPNSLLKILQLPDLHLLA
ncbi:uncharacterized protein LOC111304984 [Durio zibethinus]|uniref:Uncharacterized protein LOC111304984 n=1 Tax=Durio zibethinus TaxID=66656 RepID=A0A6P5ZZ94_DURZI|nr:uncharacterized protein LOC111304984 [Durio zibethinus]